MTDWLSRTEIESLLSALSTDGDTCTPHGGSGSGSVPPFGRSGSERESRGETSVQSAGRIGSHGVPDAIRTGDALCTAAALWAETWTEHAAEVLTEILEQSIAVEVNRCESLNGASFPPDCFVFELIRLTDAATHNAPKATPFEPLGAQRRTVIAAPAAGAESVASPDQIPGSAKTGVPDSAAGTSSATPPVVLAMPPQTLFRLIDGAVGVSDWTPPAAGRRVSPVERRVLDRILGRLADFTDVPRQPQLPPNVAQSFIEAAGVPAEQLSRAAFRQATDKHTEPGTDSRRTVLIDCELDCCGDRFPLQLSLPVELLHGRGVSPHAAVFRNAEGRATARTAADGKSSDGTVGPPPFLPPHAKGAPAAANADSFAADSEPDRDEVAAVLAEIVMTPEQIRALRPGTVLPLNVPLGAPAKLTAVDGREMPVRVGTWNGRRAVRPLKSEAATADTASADENDRGNSDKRPEN